jgi:hypothetical protein
MSGDMFEYEVEVLQEFHPSGLPACDLLRLAEVLEIFVVGSDGNWMVGTKEVGACTLESIDNGGHFLIVDIVVSFCWQEGAGMKGDGVSFIIKLLADDGPEGEVRGICVHKELFRPIGGPKHRV